MHGNGTRNTIFFFFSRKLTERAIETQRDLHLSFIDNEKAFDRIRDRNLRNINIDGNDSRCVISVYWHQIATVRGE